MIAFLLAACSSTDAGEIVAHLGEADTGPARGHDEVDHTDTDDGIDTEDGETTGLALHIESYRCEDGEYLDLDLPIPMGGAVMQGYVMVRDAQDRATWLSASDGIVAWVDGSADLYCSWTPGQAGQDVFWDGFEVSAVKVAWVSN